MGSSEMLRKFKKTETHLEDVNTPVPLSQFTGEDSPFKLKDDVADALDCATAGLRGEGISPDSVLGYYLTDKEGFVNKLEIRNISSDLAWKIHNEIVVSNLGGSISTSLGKNESRVGLPHAVNDFKGVEVEKGK
jgi:hypothetical protein